MAELTQEQIALLQKLAAESKGAMTFISGSSDDKAQGGYVVEVAMPEGGRQTFAPTDFLQMYQDSRNRAANSKLMSDPCARGEVLALLEIAAKPLHEQNATIDSKLENIMANLKFLPYQAICISLIIEKLGITDAEIDAHRTKVEAELTNDENTALLEQAIAQQTLDDAGVTGQA